MLLQRFSYATRKAASSLSTTSSRRFIHVEKRIEELGLELPPPAPPRANYNSVCVSGSHLYMSGHLPFDLEGKTLTTGRIGEDGRDVQYGYDAARKVGLGLISTIQANVGDLDKVAKIVKVFGIVNSTNDFKEQHLVLNGCSDLLMEVFGEDVGFHARSAIGTNTLPLDVSVEIEAIVELKSD